MDSRYDETYRRSLAEPEAFWAEAAEAIDWDRRWDRVFDDSRPPFYRWFPGALVNTCHNALDRHVDAGRGERTALIYDSPVTGRVARYTYAELLDRTARFAGALRRLGVGKGDRVILYMPMIPEAAMAMLACARIGAIHSVVFGGFAANELATRIDDARPKVVHEAGLLHHRDLRADACEVFLATRRHLARRQSVDTLDAVLARLDPQDPPLAPAVGEGRREHRFRRRVPPETHEEPALLRDPYRGAVEGDGGARRHAPAQQAALAALPLQAHAGFRRLRRREAGRPPHQRRDERRSATAPDDFHRSGCPHGSG